MLENIGVERALISSICQYGKEALIEIEDIGVSTESFTNNSNQALFVTLKYILDNKEHVDQALLLISLKELGYDPLFNNRKDIEYIGSLFSFPISVNNVRNFAIRLEKLHVARLAIEKHRQSIESLELLTGQESMDEIISKSEDPVFDLIIDLNKSKDNGPQLLFDDIDDVIQDLKDNPCENIGIPTPWPTYNAAIGGGLRRGGVNLISARPKCLAYGSKVYTINGYKVVEDININDILIDPYNNKVKIKEIYDHNDLDIYRVHFRDGDYVDCCRDHIWKVYKRYPSDLLKNKIPTLKSTKSLIDDLRVGKQYKWDIELCKPIEFESKNVEVDPYTLGILLGDGTLFHTAKFVTHDDDAQEIISYIEQAYHDKIKYDYRNSGAKCATYRINGLRSSIKSIGLWKHNCHTKFIPKQYIYNSVNVRLEILRGLMDADGTCVIDSKSKNSRCKYTTVSKQLALDVKEIVQSLGGLCSITNNNAKLNGKIYPAYTCEVRLFNFNPFRLKRKANKHSTRIIGELKRSISSIEYIGSGPAKCFKLDSEENLFLTNNFIVTHNCGKSTIGKEALLHFSNTLKIPCMYLDTEMSKKDQQIRSVASKSKVYLNDIETGKFGDNYLYNDRVLNTTRELKNNKLLWYQSIASKPFEEVLSIIRRWVIKEVGFGEDGRVNDCVVVYDYFKLMDKADLKDLREYEALGYQISKLTDFCKEFDFPCLAFVQLNRQNEISQSDRLIWLCNSFSKFEKKSSQEIMDDTKKGGNRKLTVCETRFGGGIEDGDYICFNFQRSINHIIEIGLRSKLSEIPDNKDEEFEVDHSIQTEEEEDETI